MLVVSQNLGCFFARWGGNKMFFRNDDNWQNYLSQHTSDGWEQHQCVTHTDNQQGRETHTVWLVVGLFVDREPARNQQDCIFARVVGRHPMLATQQQFNTTCCYSRILWVLTNRHASLEVGSCRRVVGSNDHAVGTRHGTFCTTAATSVSPILAASEEHTVRHTSMRASVAARGRAERA